MSAKYFVAIRPRTNDFHSVHKEGCPFINAVDKGIYLGVFNSDREAENEGKRHFSKSKCCPYCSQDKKVSVEEVVHSVMHYDDPEKLNYYESMLSCVN